MVGLPLISREVVERIREQQVDLSRALRRVAELCDSSSDRRLGERVAGLQGALRSHADRVDHVLRRATEGR